MVPPHYPPTGWWPPGTPQHRMHTITDFDAVTGARIHDWTPREIERMELDEEDPEEEDPPDSGR